MEKKFEVKLENEVATIELSGRLDATNAPGLMNELKQLIGKPVKDIVFMAENLEYISSAGLRAIVFAKQKIGEDTKVYLIKPQDTVLDVVKMSGLDTFMLIQDSY